MTGSWTKLYASINLKPWRTDFPVLSVYLYLIGEAVYKPTKKNDEIIQPGQCTVTYAQVCRFAGVTQKQLKRAIEVLRDDEIIEWEGRKKYCVVTIVNWEKTYGSQSQKDVKMEVKTDVKTEVIRDAKRDDSYRRTDLLTSRRTDFSNTPLTPQGGNTTENFEFEKKAESNTPDQPEPQKKKGSGQKRKGTGLSPEDWAALAFPAMMRTEDDMELAFEFARTKASSKRTEISAKRQRTVLHGANIQDLRYSIAVATAATYQAVHLKTAPMTSGQTIAGQKPAYQNAQVDFKREADLIAEIKFSDGNLTHRKHNIECRAKLYLVRQGKAEWSHSELKSVIEAHEGGKIDLNGLDLNTTNE